MLYTNVLERYREKLQVKVDAGEKLGANEIIQTVLDENNVIISEYLTKINNQDETLTYEELYALVKYQLEEPSTGENDQYPDWGYLEKYKTAFAEKLSTGRNLNSRGCSFNNSRSKSSRTCIGIRAINNNSSGFTLDELETLLDNTVNLYEYNLEYYHEAISDKVNTDGPLTEDEIRNAIHDANQKVATEAIAKIMEDPLNASLEDIKRGGYPYASEWNLEQYQVAVEFEVKSKATVTSNDIYNIISYVDNRYYYGGKVSLKTTESVESGQPVSIESSQGGKLYIIPESSAQLKMTSVGLQEIIKAGSGITADVIYGVNNIDTANLSAGDYRAYFVGSYYNNVSIPTKVFTITGPETEPVVPEEGTETVPEPGTEVAPEGGAVVVPEPGTEAPTNPEVEEDSEFT